MAVSPLQLLYAIEKLSKPVLELVAEVIETVSSTKTKRDAARRLGTLAAKRILLG